MSQRQLFNVFDSPLDFIKTYTEVYDYQKKTPVKIFYEEVPYSHIFDKQFLNFLYNCSEGTKLLEVESLINAIKSKEFYDMHFFDMCVDLYIKNIAVLLDNAENNLFNDVVLNGYLSYTDFIKNSQLYLSNFIKSVLDLYIFSNIKINMIKFIIHMMGRNLKKYINNARILTDQICIHKRLLHELNLELLVFPESIFKNDANLYSKVCISEYLVGTERKLEYSFEEYFLDLLCLIKRYLSSIEPDEAYLIVMNMLSEISLRDINIGKKHLESIKTLANTFLNSS